MGRVRRGRGRREHGTKRERDDNLEEMQSRTPGETWETGRGWGGGWGGWNGGPTGPLRCSFCTLHISPVLLLRFSASRGMGGGGAGAGWRVPLVVKPLKGTSALKQTHTHTHTHKLADIRETKKRRGGGHNT